MESGNKGYHARLSRGDLISLQSDEGVLASTGGSQWKDSCFVTGSLARRFPMETVSKTAVTVEPSSTCHYGGLKFWKVENVLFRITSVSRDRTTLASSSGVDEIFLRYGCRIRLEQVETGKILAVNADAVAVSAGALPLALVETRLLDSGRAPGSKGVSEADTWFDVLPPEGLELMGRPVRAHDRLVLRSSQWERFVNMVHIAEKESGTDIAVACINAGRKTAWRLIPFRICDALIREDSTSLENKSAALSISERVQQIQKEFLLSWECVRLQHANTGCRLSPRRTFFDVKSFSEDIDANFVYSSMEKVLEATNVKGIFDDLTYMIDEEKRDEEVALTRPLQSSSSISGAGGKGADSASFNASTEDIDSNGIWKFQSCSGEWGGMPLFYEQPIRVFHVGSQRYLTVAKQQDGRYKLVLGKSHHDAQSAFKLVQMTSNEDESQHEQRVRKRDYFGLFSLAANMAIVVKKGSAGVDFSQTSYVEGDVKYDNALVLALQEGEAPDDVFLTTSPEPGLVRSDDLLLLIVASCFIYFCAMIHDR